jgi:hypothetical protein
MPILGFLVLPECWLNLETRVWSNSPKGYSVCLAWVPGLMYLFLFNEGPLCARRSWSHYFYCWWWREKALNNLKATISAFRSVNQENVFTVGTIQFISPHLVQVCDQPNPLHVKSIVKNVLHWKFDEACSSLKQLYDLGYSPTDIITTLFRVVKNYDMAEYLKLEFLKVNTVLLLMWLTVLSLSCAG